MFERTARKADGYAVLTGPPEVVPGGIQEFDTVQCCHCGAHFHVIPGSGRRRGFCLHCMKPTCGRPECNVCMPIEKWLDQVEKGIVLP